MEEIFKQVIINHIEKIDFFLIAKTIVELIVFIIMLRLVNKVFHLFFDKIINKIRDAELKKNYQTLRQLAIYITDAIVILFFMVNILENFGVDMKPILATAGIFGVAIGFGGKKFIEDLFTGLTIIFTGQLRVGDYVTVNNSTGTVEKITLTMIVIRTYNGDVHFLRNGQIDTVINRTKNYSFPVFKVNVSYKTDIVHAMRVLKELGQELKNDPEYSKFVLSEAEVSGLDEFLDSSLVIVCRIKTTPQEQWMVKRKFNQMIKERFEKEGIEIPFPQLVVSQNKEE